MCAGGCEYIGMQVWDKRAVYPDALTVVKDTAVPEGCDVSVCVQLADPAGFPSH